MKHHIARFLVAVTVLVVSACGGDEVDGPRSPILLAEVTGGLGGSICCGHWREPVGVALCLAYDLQGFAGLGGESPFVQAAAVLGCHESYGPGTALPSVEFHPGDPGFSDVVARATDDINEILHMVAIAVDDSFRSTQPGGASGREDLVSYPRLAGSTVAFICLVIDSVSVSQNDGDVLGSENAASVKVAWQFWGAR